MIKYKRVNKVSVSSGKTGRVSIPTFIMEDLNITHGDLVELELIGNEIIIRKLDKTNK